MALALISAWCSQVQALLCWYSLKASIWLTRTPELPLGRNLISISYKLPARVWADKMWTTR